MDENITPGDDAVIDTPTEETTEGAEEMAPEMETTEETPAAE